MPALPALPMGGGPAVPFAELSGGSGAILAVGGGAGTVAVVEAARRAGMLTIALGAERTFAADHVIEVGTDDPWLAKEVCVTAYHLLWELTHLFLDAGRSGADDLGAAAGLYASLSGGTGPGAVGGAVSSTREKAEEVAGMRAVALATDGARLAACAAVVADRFSRGGRLFACGNGGSSTDATSLAHAFAEPPRPLPAVSLTGDRATVTALANDVGFDLVFARQVQAFARPGDVVAGMSTSGNSPNLIRAFDEARRRDVVTVGFAGYDGGEMATCGLVDHLFVVPSPSVHRIQEVQATLYLTLRSLTGRLLDGPGGPSLRPPPPGPG